MAIPTTTLALGIPDPFSFPGVWDTITVAGVQWQGKFEIRGAKRSYKWQVKDGAGVEGATETYRGKTPPPFHIRFYIWTEVMYVEWTSFVTLFQYNGTKIGGNVSPVDISHPQLNLLGITQVICESVGGLEKVSDDLMFAADIELREFFPPVLQNATKTPLAASVSPPITFPGFKPSQAVLDKQAQIAMLQQRAAAAGAIGGVSPMGSPTYQGQGMP